LSVGTPLQTMSRAPDLLYRFTTIDRAEEIITQGKIFFPSPKDFNDPFDCKFRPVFTASARKRNRFNRNLVRERNPNMPKYLLKRIAKRASSKASFEEAARRLIGRIGSSVGMLCLTEKNDSVLMWSHYANKHQGVCLQFRGLETLDSPPLRVVYSNDYPVVDLLEYEPFIFGQNETARAKQKEVVEHMYLTKAKEWAYEHEWRIIDWAAGRSQSRGLHMLAPDVLVGVILGCQITEGDRDRIMARVRSRDPRLNIYKAVQSSLSFTLDILHSE
jgi:hypothetical protein